ncbi:MAG: hypothetical protein DRP60_01505, partial [Spirochaetes bacterium]
MILLDKISKSLENWGSHPVMVELNTDGSENHIDAGQFLHRIDELTELFIDYGISEGVLVPLFIDNSWDYPAIFLALLRIKAIPVLAKLLYRRLEMDEIFQNSKPSVVICSADHLKNIVPWTQDILVLIYNNGEWSSQGEKKPMPGETAPGTVSVNYTYRGYGYPLGAMVGESGYLDAVRRYQSYVRFSHGRSVLALLPMSHIFTLISSVFLPLLNGLTMYIIKTLHPKIILETLKKYRIDYLSTIPEILMLLAKLYPEDMKIPSLRALVSGGSYLSEENHQFISGRFQVEVLNGYGLTEVAPVTANIRDSGKIGTIGEFCKELSCRISDSADSQSGEILVKVEDSFLGYLGRPNETSDVLKDGWFQTGDLGYEKDGMVYFSGELKRTRKVNGQIVDLKEVETALIETGMVKNAVVTGKTNHIHAEVSLKDPVESERQALKSLRSSLSEIIASYKIPKTI